MNEPLLYTTYALLTLVVGVMMFGIGVVKGVTLKKKHENILRMIGLID